VFDKEVVCQEVDENESIPFADVWHCVVVIWASNGYQIISSLPPMCCEQVMR
jgi:hypothetical protein